MEISEIRDHILDIYSKQEELDKELKANIKELQSQCRHNSVVQTDNQPSRSGLFPSIPPARICVMCSLEEAGWGYEKLHESAVLKIINRDEFYRYRKLQPLEKIEVPIGLIS